MKRDFTTTLYAGVFQHKEDHQDINKYVKAVILNFGAGDIIVTNDNFGSKRKYADFTEGKSKVGLHPGQIVFAGIEDAKLFRTRYINANDEICQF